MKTTIQNTAAVLAFVGVILAGNDAHSAVIYQQDFNSGTVGDSISTVGINEEYDPLGNGTAVISSTVVESGNSAFFSGSGSAWSRSFASPYTILAGDTVTATMFLQTSANASSQVFFVLRGLDTGSIQRYYEIGQQGAGSYMLANNSLGTNYFDAYAGSKDVWVKMEYVQSTNTLTNSYATAAAPTTWIQISTDTQLTMATFTGFVINGGDYNANGTSQYADSISVTVVPEPSTIAFLGLAALGLIVFRKRRAGNLVG